MNQRVTQPNFFSSCRGLSFRQTWKFLIRSSKWHSKQKEDENKKMAADDVGENAAVGVNGDGHVTMMK